MVKNRLIPCLFLRKGMLVQSRGFKRYQLLGNPLVAVDRYNQWGVDELVYIDITPGIYNEQARDDVAIKQHGDILEIIRAVSKRCFMPLTFGGGVRTLDDIGSRLSNGADKVTVNTKAVEDPDFITAAAREFGAQCIILSLDCTRAADGTYKVVKGGRATTDLDAIVWAKRAEELGAGEIFLNSVDRDGTGKGYDLELVKAVSTAVKIPVIACGGVGEWRHLVEGITQGEASAVAAANVFSYKEQSIIEAKRYMVEAGLNVRKLGI